MSSIEIQVDVECYQLGTQLSGTGVLTRKVPGTESIVVRDGKMIVPPTTSELKLPAIPFNRLSTSFDVQVKISAGSESLTYNGSVVQKTNNCVLIKLDG